MPLLRATMLLLLSAAPALAQSGSSLDDLLAIPRPGAAAPVMGMEGVPMVPAPFDSDAPLYAPPPLDGQAPTQDTGQEGTPFFEFTDEAAPNRPGNAPDLHGTVTWPGDIMTPAGEEAPTLGFDPATDLENVGIAPSVPEAPMGATGTVQPTTQTSDAPQAMPTIPQDPTQGFAFQDGPQATTATPGPGPILPVPYGARVEGRFAVGGGGDAEWNASAQGLGIVRVDLEPNAGSVVLVLGSDTPIFWGITAPTGTRIDGILLYGDSAQHAHIGAKTIHRARANVVRRPDLDRTGAESLVRAGGGTSVTWR